MLTTHSDAALPTAIRTMTNILRFAPSTTPTKGWRRFASAVSRLRRWIRGAPLARFTCGSGIFSSSPYKIPH